MRFKCQGRRLVPECSVAALPEALQRSCKVDSARHFWLHWLQWLHWLHWLHWLQDGCRVRLNNLEGADADLLTTGRPFGSGRGCRREGREAVCSPPECDPLRQLRHGCSPRAALGDGVQRRRQATAKRRNARHGRDEQQEVPGVAGWEMVMERDEGRGGGEGEGTVEGTSRQARCRRPCVVNVFRDGHFGQRQRYDSMLLLEAFQFWRSPARGQRQPRSLSRRAWLTGG